MIMAVTKKVFIENLSPNATNFFGQSGKFQLKGHGLVESIAEIDENIANEPYVKRAIRREKLRILTKAEYDAREPELIDPVHDHHDHNIAHISEGADHINDHFKKELPEDAWPTGPGWTAEEILAGKSSELIQTLNTPPLKHSASDGTSTPVRDYNPYK